MSGEVRTHVEFPTVKHFGAWLGLCPLVKQSGRTKKGKKKIESAPTRRGQGRAAQALCLAASSLGKNRSALGSFLRRLKACLGLDSYPCWTLRLSC
jgi:transposase